MPDKLLAIAGRFEIRGMKLYPSLYASV